MCGIAGLVRLDGGEVERWRLQAMNRAMRHRGPDGEGYYTDGPVGLAHLRLAIIDLDTGDQPMFNEDHSVAVVFNGEIYNFLDLQPQLQRRGHTFRTRSDTEVLIHAYEEWGSGMLARLNGMYAFAIYDGRRRKLLLARDRLGVKPLYYDVDGGHLAFASELGGLMAAGLTSRDIDFEALELYLHYQYIPAPSSIYKSVRKLAPAEYLEMDIASGAVKTETYWDIATHAPPDAAKTLEAWTDELDALLHDAVGIRLISDVPFGAFLSGGVDSGVVVAMMAGKLREPVKTFSIGLTDSQADELPHAREVSRKYGTQHEEFRVSPEGLTLIPRLCVHFGEPFADSSAVPTYYVSKLARSRVKMALTGDGGDEMFAGYRSYCYLANAIRDGRQPAVGVPVPGPILWRARAALQRWPTARRAVGRVWRRARGGGASAAPWHVIFDASLSHFNIREREVLLGKRVPPSPADFATNRFPFPAADDVVGMAQYCDLKAYLPGDVLVKVDRMSMANSLEVRSPLLDYRIAEMAFSMPTAVKLPEPLPDGSRSKYILRRLAVRYLGDEYVYRPKRGFGVPISRWLREDKGGYLRDTLLTPTSPLYDLVDRRFTLRLVRSHLAGKADHGAKLWNLLMLDGWLRHIHAAAG